MLSAVESLLTPMFMVHEHGVHVLLAYDHIREKDVLIRQAKYALLTAFFFISYTAARKWSLVRPVSRRRKMPITSLKRVQRSQLPDQVVENIKKYIEDNGLQPGAKLTSERELAKELGVSRTVLREALRVLQATGILDIQPGNGIFVQEFGFEALANHFNFVIRYQKHQILHLIEARMFFECGIMELVAERIQPHDFDALEAIVRRIENAKTIEEDVSVEIEFHSYLSRLTGNPILIELSSLITRFFSQAQQLRGNWMSGTFDAELRRTEANEHQEIIEALKKQDVARAKHLLNLSLQRWRQAMGEMSE